MRQGTAARLEIVLDIDEGYYVNSNRPLDRFLVPLSLKFEQLTGGGGGIILTPVLYPRATPQTLAFSKKPVLAFHGKTVLRMTAQIAVTVPVGKYVLRGKLRVQAFNSQGYLPPQTIDIKIPLEVVK